MSTRLLSGLICAVIGVGLLVGCGASSSSSSTSAPTTATTSSNPSSRLRAPLSKADYQSRGLVLLQSAVNAENAKQSDATTWARVTTAYQRAHQGFQALIPPPKVADLHQRLVSVLAAAARGAAKIRDAFETGGNPKAAGADFAAGAQQLIAIGKQFSARGYTELGR